MAENVVERLQKHLESQVGCLDILGHPLRTSPPCSLRIVEAAELRFGFGLPKLIREIYTQVANGGFGPGYGVMGLDGGFTDDQGHSIIDAYDVYRAVPSDDPTWHWPRGLVPICHWGCIIYSVLDCLNDPNPIYFAHFGAKEPEEPMEKVLHHHKSSLAEWLGEWMDGKDLWNETYG